MEISLERLLQTKQEGGQDLKKFLKTGKDLAWRRWEETLLYGVQRFFLFPGGLWDSAGVLFLHWQYVCLCAWGLWVPATGCLCWLYGADGTGVVELRVNGAEEAGRGGEARRGEVREALWGECLWSNWEWMQEFCLWRLTQSTLVGSQGSGDDVKERPRSARRWNYISHFKHGRLFCLVQLLNVQCIM